MKTFKDGTGRTWRIEINVGNAKRVKSMLGINILELFDNKLEKYSAFISDAIALIDVLFVLCMDQCQAEKISDEDFGRAMHGDIVLDARNAFIAELIDFFPAVQKKTLSSLMETVAKMSKKLEAETAKTVESLNSPETIDRMCSMRLQKLPEPLESIPTR